jgi:hypothetical protein
VADPWAKARPEIVKLQSLLLPRVQGLSKAWDTELQRTIATGEAPVSRSHLPVDLAADVRVAQDVEDKYKNKNQVSIGGIDYDSM